MHDERPVRSILAMTALFAAALAAGWAAAGDTVYDVVFAALKLVVIR